MCVPDDSKAQAESCQCVSQQTPQRDLQFFCWPSHGNGSWVYGYDPEMM